MSWKATAIPYVFSPKTSERFFVYIPKLLYAPIITKSFEIPCPNPQVITLDVWGNKFELPRRTPSGFDFTVVIPEGAVSEIELMVNKIFEAQAKVQDGDDSEIDYFDILVIPLSGLLPETFGVIEGAIQSTGSEDGMGGLNKFASAMKKIADFLLASGKPLPWVMKTIKFCYLKTAKISQWTANGATQVQEWTLVFHGHYLLNGISESEEMKAISKKLGEIFKSDESTDGTDDKNRRRGKRKSKKEKDDAIKKNADIRRFQSSTTIARADNLPNTIYSNGQKA